MPDRYGATHEERVARAHMMGAAGVGIAAALVGLFYLLSWLSGMMTSRGLYGYTLKTNTALCLILCGVSLVLGVKRDRGKGTRWTGGALAAIAVTIALLTLLQHLAGIDLGIDQMLAEEQPGAMGTVSPNRTTFLAAAGLLLCSIGILLLHTGRSAARLVQYIGIAACLVSLLGILGHLYRLEGPYVVPAIAWPTAASVLLLGLGLLLARPGDALMGVVTSGTPGGILVRRLLIPAVFLPIVLGWLHLKGELWGLYELDLGTSILVIVWIVIFSTLAFQSGTRADAQQRILEDRAAGEALRESEQRLKTILDHVAEGVIVFDADGKSVYWNRKALELHPYQEDVSTAGLQKLTDIYEMKTLDGEVLPSEMWPVPRILRGEELQELEVAMKDQKRGTAHIFSYSGLLVHGTAGEQMGLLNLRDITARKEAEAALRESERLLWTVLETLPVGVWILAADGTVLKANKAAEEIWRGTAYVGMADYGVYKGWRVDTGERIKGEEWGGARAITKGESSSEEVEIECFDGTRKIILNTAVPIRDEQGAIAGAITVNQDITARTRAVDALRESEEKFRAVFQQAAVGMGRVNLTDARWTDVNQAFCAMLGYREEEMLATPWPEITHPDDLGLDLVPFKEMASGNLESYSVEKRFIHKEGRHIWARLTLSLVRDAHGRPDYEIAIIEDITDRKQAEEALRKAKDELEQRVRERTRELEEAYDAVKRETEQRLAAVEDLREKEQLLVQQSRLAAMGEMLGNIAHQWRQPLNVLGLLIQSLPLMQQKGLLTGETLAQEAAKGMNLIQHMSQTIDDFKDFLQEEKEIKEFSVNSAVSATIALLEAPLKTANIAVTLDEVDQLSVTGHRNEFSHVILNLVNNARDALREKEVPDPKIVIRLFREGEKSVVTVADNAGGIPDDIIERIFDPYFTTKGPDKGTGIGLFMSKSIIEKKMHGRLSVRNTAEGAEFRIEL